MLSNPYASEFCLHACFMTYRWLQKTIGIMLWTWKMEKSCWAHQINWYWRKCENKDAPLLRKLLQIPLCGSEQWNNNTELVTKSRWTHSTIWNSNFKHWGTRIDVDIREWPGMTHRKPVTAVFYNFTYSYWLKHTEHTKNGLFSLRLFSQHPFWFEWYKIST